ncbi:MAG: VTT domain-containing protein [Clostridiales bacterium]|jgi:uncharacterized membrane protein YdjX (TVP38/TMEM64 family)|nr:VTT domain-containing protein [Clostridiales bacterium]
MYKINIKKSMNYWGITLVVLAVVLFFTTNAVDIDAIKNPGYSGLSSDLNWEYFGIEELTKVQQAYANFRLRMIDLEVSIAGYGNMGTIFFAIILLFAFKSFFSVVPLSATCLLSGVVFPFPSALLINILGVSLQMSVKYYWGKKRGGGNVSKFLRRNPVIEDMFEHEGSGNPWILFVCRVVPYIPVNPVSQMYGHMNFKYTKYLIISLIGASIKILSYTIIGSNVYDPLSSAFIVPVIIVLLLSGTTILLVNLIVAFRNKTTPKKKDYYRI